MRRLCFFVAFCSILLFSAVAENFQITEVTYDLHGRTRQYAVENAVEIAKKRVFHSYDEFSAYIKDIEQQFQNQRVFESSSVTVTYGEAGSNGITPVSLFITTKDTHSFLAVPYPKYNSNDGFDLKLKMKDMNFLGTMSVMNFDVHFAIENDEDDSDKKDYVVGLNFSYDYPFKLGPFKASWNNDFGFDYTFGETKPEFDVSTGLSFTLPFDMFSICVSFTQTIARSFDFTEYGDELYFTEAASISLPIILKKIDNWGNITWTPTIAYSWNWDDDGIDKENDALSSPLLTVSHTIATSRIDWVGNFRQGISAKAGQSIGYNFQRKEYIPKVWAEIAGYFASKYIGLNGRLYGVATYNSYEKIGSYLRGIRDNAKYDSYDFSLWSKKITEVPVAFVGNIDLPIHIITTHWNDWFTALFGEDAGITRAFSFMRYLDFELQLSPFVDVALAKNYATGRLFSIKDGFYTGGIEMLIFPAKWRSLEVRASLGVDLGRKVIKKVASSLIDTSWRRGSAYEVSIGIGLHY